MSTTRQGRWNYPTTVHFGVGKIAMLPEACGTLGMKRPLLVTDPGIAALPILEQALSLLGLEDDGTTEDLMFTVQSVNCLGACALAPLVIMDGVYHHNMSPAKLRSLINKVRKEERGPRDA